MTRKDIARAHRWSDATFLALPEISRHDRPQPSPQEYRCGCIAVVYVTDRNRDAEPFEMRLAIACGTSMCDVYKRGEP